MPESKIQTVSRKDQVSTIEIYSDADNNLQGRFINARYGERVFKNLISLILLIEDCMDSMDFPQPMHRYRKLDNVEEFNLASRKMSYRDSEDKNIPEESMPEEWQGMRPEATFNVRIAFRTISGWQGEADCPETGKDIKFRSDLEFILFMVDELKLLHQ